MEIVDVWTILIEVTGIFAKEEGLQYERQRA